MIDPCVSVGRFICSTCGFASECAAHLVPAAGGAAFSSVCQGCFRNALARLTNLTNGPGTFGLGVAPRQAWKLVTTFSSASSGRRRFARRIEAFRLRMFGPPRQLAPQPPPAPMGQAPGHTDGAAAGHAPGHHDGALHGGSQVIQSQLPQAIAPGHVVQGAGCLGSPPDPVAGGSQQQGLCPPFGGMGAVQRGAVASRLGQAAQRARVTTAKAAAKAARLSAEAGLPDSRLHVGHPGGPGQAIGCGTAGGGLAYQAGAAVAAMENALGAGGGNWQSFSLNSL